MSQVETARVRMSLWRRLTEKLEVELHGCLSGLSADYYFIDVSPAKLQTKHELLSVPCKSSTKLTCERYWSSRSMHFTIDAYKSIETSSQLVFKIDWRDQGKTFQPNVHWFYNFISAMKWKIFWKSKCSADQKLGSPRWPLNNVGTELVHSFIRSPHCNDV